MDEYLVKTEISLVDGKVLAVLMEDPGSFCHCCNVIKEETNDFSNILLKRIMKKCCQHGENWKMEKSFIKILRLGRDSATNQWREIFASL